MEKNDKGAGGPGHETRDVRIAPVAWAVVALVAAIPVAMLLMDWTFDYFAARERREQPVSSTLVEKSAQPQPPEPRLQSAESDDLRIAREHETQVLSSYGWIDRESGRVRIPISRAMDLLAERGLPAGPQSDPASRDER